LFPLLPVVVVTEFPFEVCVSHPSLHPSYILIE
jgi:hypothetical protein